jgi:hypothetical protein
MRLYIAEHIENEYIIGAFTTIEKAMEECRVIAIRDDIAPTWEPPHPEEELPQWCGYQHGRMTFYICTCYLDNEVD